MVLNGLKDLSKRISKVILEPSIAYNSNIENDKFSKTVGIIFLIGEGEYHYKKEVRKTFVPYDKKKLFDPLPCAHLLLQLNTIQDIFNYQIISTTQIQKDIQKDNLRLRMPKKEDNGHLFEAFDVLVKDIESIPNSKFKMDYWIGLTSLDINTNVDVPGRPGGSFYEVFDKEIPKVFHNEIPFGQETYGRRGIKRVPTQSGKIMALVTSSLWEKYFCPPSLFEYMSFTTFMCSLHFLSLEFGGKLKGT